MKDRESSKKTSRKSAEKFVESEAELVRILRAPLDRGSKPKTLRLENGHDAAVLSGFSDRGVAMTVDRVVEGVHFRRGWSDARSIASKVFASNVSDLVAVGARPSFGLLSLTFEERPLPVAEAKALAGALAAEARRYGMRVVGGNVTRARGPFTADLTAVGSVDGKPFRRDGARPGNVFVALGTHGEAAAGLACLRHYGEPSRVPEAFRALVRAQLYPRVRLEVLDVLRRFPPAAAMDTSDGLVATMATMAEMSGCAVDVDAPPPSKSLQRAADALGVDPRAWTMSGGEDYGLVVVFRGGIPWKSLEAARIPAHVVGLAEGGRGIRSLPPGISRGWDPFR